MGDAFCMKVLHTLMERETKTGPIKTEIEKTTSQRLKKNNIGNYYSHTTAGISKHKGCYHAMSSPHTITAEWIVNLNHYHTGTSGAGFTG